MAAIRMKICVQDFPESSNAEATDLLVGWLAGPAPRTLLAAAGTTPLDLYSRVAVRRLDFSNLRVFALDEYLGVPTEEPRNCGCLLRRAIGRAWRIPPERYFAVTTIEADALESIRKHEQRIAESGGLDAVVLGLGQNGHIGFNEPGSTADSTGRILSLDPISVEANRRWFGGDYAPDKGVTVGLKTILAARHVLIMAYGPHKAAAVRGMLEGPVGPSCPASFLRSHPELHVFLDRSSAAELTQNSKRRKRS